MLLALILFPLGGFLFSLILGKKLPKTALGFISSSTILASFIIAILVFGKVGADASGIKQHIFTFLEFKNIKIDFGLFADRITSVMLLVITGIGFLIHLYSISYMHNDEGFYKFFAYLNLFIFNMLVLVLGSNLLILFFGWEGVGLCSYLLIGFWYSKFEYGKAARKAFIMNRIGDLGMLLAIFMCFQAFGTLDFAEINAKAMGATVNTTVLTGIAFLLFLGAMGKSAQIPLYTWLPDAMAGPTPVSALIHAATMVTAGVYLLIRTQPIFFLAPGVNEFVMIIGLVTSLVAAVIGLKQNDIKKVLAYSTVSQLGFMFIALGVGSVTAALFHLVTHAFFKALLFLGSGSVIHAMSDEQDIRRMGGLKKWMPITYFTFLIGTLAITGFPFLSGFFSKDEILVHSFMHNKLIWGLAVISATLTGLYMFRMFFVVFFGSFRGTKEQEGHLHESPSLMTIPLILLAILSVFGGLINAPQYLCTISEKLKHWIEPNILVGNTHVKIDHGIELMLIAVAVLVFASTLVFQYIKYVKKQNLPEEDEVMKKPAIVLSNKLYIDEAYDKLIVEPTEHLGEVSKWVDNSLFGKIPKTTEWIGMQLSKLNSKIQNGNLEYYLVYMSIGVFVLLIASFFIK